MREEGDEEGAENAANAVNRKDIEAVVVVELVLHRGDEEEADNRSSSAEDDRGAGSRSAVDEGSTANHLNSFDD